MNRHLHSASAALPRHATPRAGRASARRTALVAATALVLGLSPASAATIEAIFEGTVVGGFETGGIFLPPGSLFSGESYVAKITYDTSVGTPERISDTVTLRGGAALGSPSPVLSAELTINGVSEVVPTENLGQILIGGGIFDLQMSGFLTGPSSSSLTFSVVDPAFVNPPIGSNLDITGTFDFTSDLTSSFSLRNGTADFAVGAISMTRLTLSLVTATPPPPPPPPPQPEVVPLPASALLLLGALSGLGLLRRRT
jgi:hypothetical protein